MADKIYRVRIEAYYPETGKSEVILEENEDGGYYQFLFFGVNEEDTLRSISAKLNALDTASMLESEELTRRAVAILIAKYKAERDPSIDMMDEIMAILKEGGYGSCLQ